MSRLLNQVRALTFDVFGTVVDWRGSIAREFQALLAPRGIERDWDLLAREWRRLYQPAMETVRSGARSFVPLDVLHRENLERVLGEHGLDLAMEDADHLNRGWHRLAPWPDSVPGMQRLRGRYVLASLSNGNVALMVNMARHVGIPWDAILGAEFARAYKPEPEAYFATARALGLSPGECLMVAAHNADLRAARACGFRTAYVNRPTEFGPSQSADIGPEEDWDLSCESITELARALRT